MDIDLPSDEARFVEGLVASGEYRSVDDVVADGVRLLMGRRQLRAEIQQGIDELDRGEGIDGRRVFAELRQRASSQNESTT